MPYEFKFDDGIAIVQFFGRVTGPDFREAGRALLKHPSFAHGQPRIWDMRGITELLVDLETVKQIPANAAELVPALGPAARVATVAVREVDQEIAELYRAYMPGRPTKVFDNIQDAKAWVLGDEVA